MLPVKSPAKAQRRKGMSLTTFSVLLCPLLCVFTLRLCAFAGDLYFTSSQINVCFVSLSNTDPTTNVTLATMIG
jgi:hypothetical protein